MRFVFIALALVLGSAASADELDQARSVSAQPSLEQIKASEHIPGTVIVRVKKDDPTKFEVAHVAKKLAPGESIENLTWEQMALNSEKTGVAYAAKDELDATSSTSTWGFGYAGGAYGSAGYIRGPYRSAGFVRGPYGAAGFVRGPNGFVAGGYRNSPGYYPYYPYNDGCPGANHCGYYGSDSVYAAAAYYPTYTYQNYAYDYAPYYGYSSGGYDYAYCGWAY